MSDQQQSDESLASYVRLLFAPATLQAFGYAIAAIAPLAALFGFTGLTPVRIQAIVNYAQTFGTATLAVLALVGIIGPLAVAIFGVLASRLKNAVERVRALAKDPSKANAAAAQALTAATAELAKSGDVQKSKDAVNALVKATIGLNQVQTIVAAPEVAKASSDASVVSAAEHDVSPKK